MLEKVNNLGVILDFLSASKSIVDNRVMHQQAVKLLECLCDKLKTLNDTPVASLSCAILQASHLDIDKVVLNIVEAYPTAAYCQDNNGRNVLHIAVENRCKNVFNLVCGTSVLMHDLVDERDNNGNNIVHLAGKLAPPHKLNLVSGAALQMQRELQWFKVTIFFLLFYLFSLLYILSQLIYVGSAKDCTAIFLIIDEQRW